MRGRKIYACQPLPDRSKPVNMKNKALRLAVTLGLSSSALLLSACPKHGIVIEPIAGGHPEIETKWGKIEEALKGHPELYYIEVYQNGIRQMPPPPSGKLCEILIETDLVDLRNRAKATNYTGHAAQIGVGWSKANPSVTAFGPVPRMPQAHFPRKIAESQELVEVIKGILEQPNEPESAR